MRALTRARAEASSDRQDAPCRLTAFGRRHEMRYTGRAHGSSAPLRWRSAGVGPTPPPPIVFPEDVRAVPEPPARLQRLEQALHAPVQAWRLSPVVEALQAVRGGPGTVAVPLGAARGALTRGDPPRARRPCVGLVPAASASGEQRRQGSLPKAGTTHARRGLGAGAWASRSPAQVSRHWPRRLATPPNIIQALRWKAPGRLWKRDRRLVSRGQHAQVVPVAMARALAGCLWAMAREGPITPSAQHIERMQPRTQKGDPGVSGETQPRCGVTLDGVERLRQDPRAATEAGTRRTPGRGEPPHGSQQDQPSPLAGSGSSDAPRTKTS